ncbi:fabG [Symbiodinium pilosum]|uniref:FabG protein n=1 Tax=Symbiodinium pilosum TaxID=2952 RepID=A0A812QIH9_SYMPI|nr:fabG [Symbiodinium pilosum]
MPMGRKYTPIGSSTQRQHQKRSLKEGILLSSRRRILMVRYLSEQRAERKARRKVSKEARRRHQDWGEDRLMHARLQRSPLALCCRQVAHCLVGEPAADTEGTFLKREQAAFEQFVRLLMRASSAVADAGEQVDYSIRRRRHSMAHVPDDEDATSIRMQYSFTKIAQV